MMKIKLSFILTALVVSVLIGIIVYAAVYNIISSAGLREFCEEKGFEWTTNQGCVKCDEFTKECISKDILRKDGEYYFISKEEKLK